MNKQEMLEALRGNVCSVVFVKKDGTERSMPTATLVESLIPEDKRPKGVKPAQPESSIMRVFDIELGEFRSINSDTVKEFTVRG